MGRVLVASGMPIQGLYACGNDAACLMRGDYPSAGITIGPAIVFAYRAAKAIVADNLERRPFIPYRTFRRRELASIW